MAATSTQGTGPGSASGFNKGSQHQTLGVGHLIGSRVVMTGKVALTSGTPSTAVVTFPKALDSSFTYTALITPIVTSSGSAPSGSFAVHNLNVNTLTIVGPNSTSQEVYWVVNKV
jgi:hypothetical protein